MLGFTQLYINLIYFIVIFYIRISVDTYRYCNTDFILQVLYPLEFQWIPTLKRCTKIKMQVLYPLEFKWVSTLKLNFLRSLSSDGLSSTLGGKISPSHLSDNYVFFSEFYLFYVFISISSLHLLLYTICSCKSITFLIYFFIFL